MVNDWEEYKLGLDPTKAVSNNLDGNGQPMSDYAYVVSRLASQNVVTIAATDPDRQPARPGPDGDTGPVFTVTRGGFPLNAMTVNLALGGTGHRVRDVEGWTTLACRARSPCRRREFEDDYGDAAGQHQLANAGGRAAAAPSGTGYTVGDASNASVMIYPSPTAPGSGLMGYYSPTPASTYTNAANFNPANFSFTRLDPTIDFTWGTTNSFPPTTVI